VSYDESDAAWDMYMSDLYEEHRGDEFTTERLQSYYRDNPELAAPAGDLLAEARALLESSPRAALVLGASAGEVGVKAVILRPIVHGLVHSEAAAGLISELAVGHTGVERFAALLSRVLADHGGTNVAEYRRAGGDRPLLEELKQIQQRRNGVLHRGEQANREGADQAIDVAATLLENLFPTVLSSLQMHVHDWSICPLPNWECDSNRDQATWAVAQRP
jgi:hypothetical protein